MAVFTPVINGEEHDTRFGNMQGLFSVCVLVTFEGEKTPNVFDPRSNLHWCVCLSGVAGNLVAVQASRISTYLHMNGIPMGDPNPTARNRKCPTPCSTFFTSSKVLV